MATPPSAVGGEILNFFPMRADIPHQTTPNLWSANDLD
jgi:hypothetical protein